MPGPDKKAYKGWRGTIKAALDHHPDKFSKEACKKGGKKSGKLCPYAVFTKKKEEGDTPHYKEQPHTTSGKPKKKAEFKNEYSFAAYVAKRELLENEEICECGHHAKEHQSAGQGRSNLACEHPDCDCDNFKGKKMMGAGFLNGVMDLP